MGSRHDGWRGRVALGVLAALQWAAADLAVAEEAGHRVSFRVSRAQDVDNDRVDAVLAASAETPRAPDAAGEVNRAMQWALERARREEAVIARTTGYRTYPVHEDGQIRRWRAHQELLLESGDVEAITALVGELQARLALQSFSFRVSDVARRQAEAELIDQALAAFRSRAEQVQRGLDAKAWSLDELSIDPGMQRPPLRMRALGKGAQGAPAVEAGTSRIEVGVQATIVLE